MDVDLGRDCHAVSRRTSNDELLLTMRLLAYKDRKVQMYGKLYINISTAVQESNHYPSAWKNIDSSAAVLFSGPAGSTACSPGICVTPMTKSFNRGKPSRNSLTLGSVKWRA